MLGYVQTVTLDKKKYSLSRQGEACKDKMDASKTPRSVSLRGVRLRAVLVNFRFSKIFRKLDK